jgi:hypothetical protein
MASQVRPAVCADKQRLLDFFVEAACEILRLEIEQMQRVTEGKLGFEGRDLGLTVARENRDKAKLAYERICCTCSSMGAELRST